MKKFTKLLKEKRWKWTAGGVACLVVVAMIFALSSGIGVRAETINLGENNTIELNKDDVDNAYLITDASQLKALGNATSGKTNGMKFKLANDINISVSAPATGTFEGTFDGDGHVIAFSNSSITVADEIATSDSKVQGLLFGTVASGASVQNLIVDVQGVSYTRNAKSEVQGTLGEITYTSNPLINGTVGGVNSSGADLELASNIHNLGGDANSAYKTKTETGISASQIKTYEAIPGEDYFGVICGENEGRIQKVYVTGSNVSVTRNESEALGYSTAKIDGTANVTYYYEQSVDETEGEATLNIQPNGIEIVDSTTNLKAILSYSENEEKYTLNLTNNNTLSPIDISKVITVTIDLGWKKEDGTDAGTSVSLGALEGITLTKTALDSSLAGVIVSAELIHQAYQYTYDASKTVVDGFVETSSAQEIPADTTKIISGNELYVGGIAGRNLGKISQVKQSSDLTVTNANAGGIAGIADGGLSDIYLLSGNDYVGSGSAEPSNSASSAPDSAPGDNWSFYTKYNASGEAAKYYDLDWLIQKENAFSYSGPDDDEIDGAIVNLNVNNKKTSKVLEYETAYRARKSMQATTEETVYTISGENTGKIALGDSGYYELLSAYATDGYYHYFDTAVAENGEITRVYPYDKDDGKFKTENPYAVKECKVVRSTSPVLEDSVQITFENILNGKVYYNAYEADSTLGSIPNTDVNSSTVETDISENILSLPFRTSSIKYQLVPVVVEGTGENAKIRIYPTQVTSPSFVQEDKQPLPRPEVKCYSYYDADGNKKTYEEFSASKSYEAGTDMLIVPRYSSAEDETYSISYLYSTTEPEAGAWDTSNNEEVYRYRYKGTDTDFMDQATAYSGSAVIPDSVIADKVYLYIKVSAKNYDPQIYYYGPFEVIKKDKLTASTSAEEGNLINGDVVTITGADSFQWLVSSEPRVTFENSDWVLSTTNGSADITMNSNNGGYIYARIKYGAENDFYYSEVFEFTYTFGGVCADPRVTPNTGVAGGNADEDEIAAATISASTAISISSRTENANIFYRVSDQRNPFTMTRVLTIPSEITNDGDSYAQYVYFKVGGRWYRTAEAATEEENVKRYPEGTSVFLSNETKEAKLKYVSAIAIAEGYESSLVLNYVYKVQPAQQAATPEAAIETYHTPGGIDIARASVELGKTISFYSVTPEAKLYMVDPSTGEVSEEPILDNSLTVTGNYGGTFAVTLLAKKDGMLDSDPITFVYDIAEQEKAATPTATPGTTADVPTTVIPGNKILLSTTTKEAQIFYTTDGKSPEVEETENGFKEIAGSTTQEYKPDQGIEMPRDGSGYFSITAVAVKTGLAQSEEAHFIYNYPDAVLEPYATVDSGKVELNTQVLLKNLTEGATIYYTVTYGELKPDDLKEDPTLSSFVFSEEYPFTITQKTTIRAMAAKDGVKSKVVEFFYDPMTQLAAPTASIPSGSVVARGSVLTLNAASGATIYYTMDGSDPSDSANTAVMVGDSLILNGDAGGQITIKAFAKAADKSQSEVVTFTYQFSKNNGGVTASIESGSEVSNGTKVNLMSDVTDGDIYYTTDGSSPVEYGKKGTTVELNGTPGSSVTVKAVVIVNGEPGNIATFIYKIKEKPTAPTASPAGGTLTIATRVTLSSSGEKIYYTTDGTTPTKSSALYEEPILINRTTTLQAIGVSKDGEISDVAVFTYTAAEKAASVTASAVDGAVLEPGEKIKLSSATNDVQIYYSTDGTEPTVNNLDSMLLYDGEAIEIHRNVMIQAVAYREDLRLSDVKSWSYFVDSIPAVEQKEAEAAKLAEEGLKDTDVSGLSRKTDESGVVMRTVREKEYKTSISYPTEAFSKQIVLETIKAENNPYTVKKSKGIFGDDITVLETYKMKAKIGSMSVQPQDEVEIALQIPNGYEDATLTVAYVQDDYNLTTLETRREADILYVKTEKLGSYVIIGPERVTKAKSEFPYLLLLEAIAGITLVGGIAFYVEEKIKKSKKKR